MRFAALLGVVAFMLPLEVVHADQAPTVGGPTALLKLKSIAGGWFNPNWNGFDAFDNDRCQGRDTHSQSPGTLFGIGRNTTGVPVAAGSRLFLRALSFRANYRGRSYAKMEPCVNVVSFVPEAGHVYEVSQAGDGEWCRTDVADQATSAPPPTFETVATRWSCKV